MPLYSSIIKIIEKTLNQVDARLMDHGKRAAYIAYKAMKNSGYAPEQIRRATRLALLHDIGAYKTEEVNSLVQFETQGVWQHAIYGYLFIKHFSPLADMAPSLLFHHANCKELTYLDPRFHELAQILHIADRFDVLGMRSDMTPERMQNHFEKRRDSDFKSEYLDMFFYNGWQSLTKNMENDKAFAETLYGGDMTEEELNGFVTMIVLSIDFRSPQTVTHTIAAACGSEALAELVGLDGKEMEHLYYAVMLHDLGKVSTPGHILEKKGRLTPEEMEIMKEHVSMSKTILTGLIDPVICDLAVRHHEKLDGTGYPDGLDAASLTKGQRLVAVADIFSALCGVRTYKDAYPKEKVFGIFRDMRDKGFLDKDIVNTLLDNFDDLQCQLDLAAKPMQEMYDNLMDEFVSLMVRSRTFKDGKGTGEIC